MPDQFKLSLAGGQGQLCSESHHTEKKHSVDDDLASDKKHLRRDKKLSLNMIKV